MNDITATHDAAVGQAMKTAQDAAAGIGTGATPEEIGIYGKKIAATTPDDVDAAAKKYLPASHAAIIAVGEGKVVREALAPFGIQVQPAP